MVALHGTPATAAHLLVIDPAVEGSQGEVIKDQPLAGADEVLQRRLGAVSPTILRAAVVVVDDDEVVVQQRLGPEAAGLFVDADLELPRVFEDRLQDRCRFTPGVHMLPGEDQHLDLVRIGRRAWLCRRDGGRQAHRSIAAAIRGVLMIPPADETGRADYGSVRRAPARNAMVSPTTRSGGPPSAGHSAGIAFIALSAPPHLSPPTERPSRTSSPSRRRSSRSDSNGRSTATTIATPTVAVSYRKKGEQAWKEGLPLLRIGNERINENALQYIDAERIRRKHLRSRARHRVRVPLRPVRSRRRRRQSRDTSSPSARAPSRSRPRAARSITSILPATTARSRSRRSPDCWPRTTPARRTPTTSTRTRRASSPATRFWCTPASTRTTATATAAGLGTVSSGTYFLTQSGTPDKPIVIKGAGDGEAIFDGDGAYNLFNVMAANYNYFEGLTIRNTDLAFQARPEEHHRLERPHDQELPLRKRRPGDLHRLVRLEGLLHRRQRDDRPLQPELSDGLHRAHLAEPAGVQSEAGVRVRGEGLRLRTRRGVQLHRQLPRRRRRRDLRQSGRQPESRSAIACRCRSISTATTSPTWRTTASRPTAARTTSASSAIAASITAIAR